MKIFSNNKILLVNIGNNRSGRIYKEYPLGVGYIGTILEKAGVCIKIFDTSLDQSDLHTLINEFSPEIIGFSFLSTDWSIAFSTIKEVRNSFNGRLIAGGIHTTLFPEDVLQAGIDVVLLGEGESCIIPAVQALLFPESHSINDVPGVAYYRNGEFHKNPNAAPIRNLDDIPFINRDLYHNLSLYNHHSILTSRGCPHSCKFCCNWGAGGIRLCRSRTPMNVLAEVEMLISRYQAKMIYFADDLFFFTNTRRKNFCQLIIDKGMQFEWVVQLRADSINLELLRLMRQAGCIKVCYGIESGDQSILNASGKKMTVQQIRNAISQTRKAGIKSKTWWILGLPGNFEQQMQSLNLMLETRPNEISIHSLIPLPGSEYWDNAEKYGIRIKDYRDFGSLYYHSIPNGVEYDYLSLEQMKELFGIFIEKLRVAGYRTTDEAKPDDEFILSTPFEKKGFKV